MQNVLRGFNARQIFESNGLKREKFCGVMSRSSIGCEEQTPSHLNYPAASCGVSKAHHANASHSVTPEFFSPGSRSGLAWIPA